MATENNRTSIEAARRCKILHARLTNAFREINGTVPGRVNHDAGRSVMYDRRQLQSTPVLHSRACFTARSPVRTQWSRTSEIAFKRPTSPVGKGRLSAVRSRVYVKEFSFAHACGDACVLARPPSSSSPPVTPSAVEPFTVATAVAAVALDIRR